MQICELHFNPKNKEGKIIDTFCYQPEDVYEKRLGSLVIGGELKGADSSKKTLLNNLAYKIKSTYHSLPTRSQEEAIREGLKAGNQFLTENKETGKNLNLAVLSIKSNQLQFSRIGNPKILLSRGGEVTDIGKNAEEGADSFGSIVSGKIKRGDKLIILTEEIYNEFVNQELIVTLADKDPINDQKLETISKVQKEKFPRKPGVCILVDFSAESAPASSKIVSKNKFSFKKFSINTAKEIKKVSAIFLNNLKETTKATVKLVRENAKPIIVRVGSLFPVFGKRIKTETVKLKEKAERRISDLKESRSQEKLLEKDNKKEPELRSKVKEKKEQVSQLLKDKKKKVAESKILKSKPKAKKTNKTKSKLKKILSSAREKLKKFNPSKKIKEFELPDVKRPLIPEGGLEKRSFYLGILLVAIILVGSIVTHSERQRRLEAQRETLNLAQGMIDEIDTADEDAFENLKYHYENLSLMINERIALEGRAREIRGKAASKMLLMTPTTVIDDPQLIFEASEIVPNKIEIVGSDIYLYNPFLSNAEKYNLDTENKLIRPSNLTDGGIFSITSMNNRPIIFSRPNTVVEFLEDDEIVTQLSPPADEYDYRQIKAYGERIYLLERETNQIIRHEIDNPENPNPWILERVPGTITSIALDGSIWVLKEGNEIWQYENRRPVTDSLIYENKIYPFPERFTKIETGPELPIFAFEPKKNRVLIFSKEGDILKQILLPEAENLKDFSVLNLQKIYLLDGQKVYEVETGL